MKTIHMISLFLIALLWSPSECFSLSDPRLFQAKSLYERTQSQSDKERLAFELVRYLERISSPDAKIEFSEEGTAVVLNRLWIGRFGLIRSQEILSDVFEVLAVILPHLSHLDLKLNDLESISPKIEILKELQSLNLSDNLLEGLPHEMGNLKKLKWLSLSKNNLSEIPEFILNLPEIEYLYVIENQINPTHFENSTAKHPVLNLFPERLFSVLELGRIHGQVYVDIGNEREVKTIVHDLSDLQYAMSKMRILKNPSPDLFEPDHQYTFVMTLDGDVIFGKALDGWEYGVKHFQLANGKKVFCAGELEIPSEGSYFFNLESGTYMLRTRSQMGYSYYYRVIQGLSRYFEEFFKRKVQYVKRPLLPEHPPSQEELRNICLSLDFRERNPDLCFGYLLLFEPSPSSSLPGVKDDWTSGNENY